MRVLIAIAVLLTVTGCEGADPLETIIPPDVSTWESNEGLKAATESLGEEEKRLFAAYSMRAALSSAFGGTGIPEGTTIGQAVQLQRQWEAEQAAEKQKQEALKQEFERRRVEQLRAMNEVLTASLLSLEFRESDFRAGRISDQFAIRVVFENLSGRAISGTKGVVIFRDVFGDTIKRVNLAHDETIEPGEMMTWSGAMDYNQFRDDDTRLRSTDPEKLGFEWEPVAYIFEDGDRLEMPK